MFERFTERARQVVVLAQDEARALNHNYIGTEHLLLGLLGEEEGIAARALESLEITVEDARATVMRVVGRGDEVPAGQIPFTPRAQKVLELALREALSMGHNSIGTEHVLLGVVGVSDGVAVEVLRELGADAETIRREIMRTLSGGLGRPQRLRKGIEVETPSSDLVGQVRAAKLTAIELQLFPVAAKLAEIERDLTGREPD